MSDQSQPLPLPPSRHHIRHIVRRTLSKSWDDSIFSESAQAAFWCALSLPPLLLGMLGSLAYIAPLFGPETLPAIQDQLIGTAERFFSSNVVDEIIAPTVRDIVKGARGEVVSIGFVISLWAGSSAISSFVDSVVDAHDQTPLRHPVRQRFFALGLYVAMLVAAIAAAPFVALGPPQDRRTAARELGQRAGLRLLPAAVRHACWSGSTFSIGCRLPEPLPSHRLVLGSILATVVFLAGDVGPAVLPDMDHQHRIHLRRAGDADRVPVVRLLPGLRDHDGRRTQRRQSRRSGPRRPPMPNGSGRGSRARPSRSTATERADTERRQPPPPRHGRGL